MQPGNLTISADPAFGVIRVLGVGFWTPTIIGDHFDELAFVMRPYRAAGVSVRMVVDLRKSGIQSQETIVRMQAGVKSVTRPGDRMAIVVSSSLAKIQMRRMIGGEQHEFFVSPGAAQTWADAYQALT